MNQGQTIFSQVIEFLPWKKFRQCVNRYNGNHRIRSFTCYNQFLCMAFAQPPGEAEGDPADNIVLYLYLEFLAHGQEYGLTSNVTLRHDLRCAV